MYVHYVVYMLQIYTCVLRARRYSWQPGKWYPTWYSYDLRGTLPGYAVCEARAGALPRHALLVRSCMQ